MKIASWNVNSIRARLEHLVSWLGEYKIDVALLQETKCINDAFPKEILEDLGYNCAVFGQKSYNGVAILSKYCMDDVVTGETVFPGDQQARYIEALINGTRVASVYVPNGQSPEAPAYQYKMNFIENLKQHIIILQNNYTTFIVGGDFNIAPTDLDVYNPAQWKGKICCTDRERESFRDLLDSCNLQDCMRQFFGPQEVFYTWWDYRTHGFLKNNGLRLDHFLSTNNVELSSCYVNKNIRSLIRPSDHAPIEISIVE